MPAHRSTADPEPLTPAQARRLYGYNERVFERYARFVRRLPLRVARRRRGIGHESLFDTLVHVLNVHEVWIGHIVQGNGSERELEELFRDRSRHPTDWKGFARYDRRVWSTVHRFLDTATSRELERPVHAFWMPGRYRASDGVLQATLEQAHHLGEVIGALWQDDREPPEMTWIRLTAGRR